MELSMDITNSHAYLFFWDAKVISLWNTFKTLFVF